MSAARGDRQVIMIRHGQSTANAGGIWQGQLDYPLSPLGREQAAAVGRALADERLSAFYASPLLRAFETARIAAGEAGYAGEIVAVEGLKERHGGSLQGTTRAEREAENPDFVRKLLSLPEEEWWPLVGAETDEEIVARFRAALRGILARHGEGETLVLVSHGGVMRAYLRDTFGPGVLAGDRRLPNASITRLAFPDGEPPRLLRLPSAEAPLPG